MLFSTLHFYVDIKRVIDIMKLFLLKEYHQTLLNNIVLLQFATNVKIKKRKKYIL